MKTSPSQPRLNTYPVSPIQLFIKAMSENEEITTALKDHSAKELNKTTLADIAGIGYSIVHRTDLGLYDSLPPRLNSFFRKIDPDPKHHWNVAYLNYKKALLVEHKEIVSPRLWLRVPTNRYASWTEFRELVADTQMEFAKLFLINPAILQHYESGTTKYLPVVIMNRLRYFGMAPEDVAYLSELPVGEKTV